MFNLILLLGCLVGWAQSDWFPASLPLFINQPNMTPEKTLSMLKDEFYQLDSSSSNYNNDKERAFVEDLIDLSKISLEKCDIKYLAHLNHLMHMMFAEHIKRYFWFYRNEQLLLCKLNETPIKDAGLLDEKTKDEANLLFEMFSSSPGQFYQSNARLAVISYLNQKKTEGELTSNISVDELTSLFQQNVSPVCNRLISEYGKAEYDIAIDDFDQFDYLSSQWNRRIILCRHIMRDTEKLISQLLADLGVMEQKPEQATSCCGQGGCSSCGSNS